MKFEDYRKHEVAFCAEVSKWADHFFDTHPDVPLGTSDIESYGRGNQKRHDLRFYERSKAGRGELALSAEVKLPGTAHGRSPFDPALVQDAFEKADRAVCRYFFTWNVEELALFDRHLVDRPLYERCIGQWPLGLQLNRPSDIERPDVKKKLYEEFLPRFFGDFAEIYLQRRKDFALPLSDLYITVLESHLAGPMGPVRELRDFLTVECESNKRFESEFLKWLGQQQWNYNRKDPDSWQETVERAARSMVYVLSNRILFYQAVRLRYELPDLDLPARVKTPDNALRHLRTRFEEAVFQTGDYEPVFFPDGTEEWAARTALSGANSLDSWGKVIRAVEKFSFDQIPTDVLGGIFQKLISPEERHKFGQHYTDENIVDVINAFCIRRAEANVLDPACGSGGFLVRAYYRKAQLRGHPAHHELLQGLYGCDINAFPAHLATLNLAARNISQQENYPRIVRKNFFKVSRDAPFCEIPKATRKRNGEREHEEIFLPELDAVVGNPPYVRQELIARAKQKGAVKDQTKEYILEVVERAWPGINLSGQSDLHIYFWPVATQFLKEGGWFGFLTSSSWLDFRYGFALQRWLLLNFEIIAVIESVHEPWFEDARVKTAVTVLRRCSDPAKRDENSVRFVRVKCPLAEILGERHDEEQRQAAANGFRDLVLRTKNDFSNDQVRIMIKRQADLWKDGLSVAEMFARQRAIAGQAVTSEAESEIEEEDETDTSDASDEVRQESTVVSTLPLDYGGGKWGRYLRAPDFYFEVVQEFGTRFTRLGDVAAIKRGITSGCDAFFMPRDVSKKLLERYGSELEWRMLPLMPHCRRSEVESGAVAIIESGDSTLHPIERQFVRPEVHSLMQVDRPLVSPEQTDRVVLWVDRPLDQIKGTYAEHYIRWGAKRKFTSRSNKSKNVLLPERPSCQGRDPWYDVTGLKPGIAFWPMTQKYRHIVPGNPYGLACNHRLFDVRTQ
jgi:N-6 DNA Methylase